MTKQRTASLYAALLGAMVKRQGQDISRVRRAQQVCGIGAQTASALVAAVSNPQDFCNGRQLAAWAGLVPRQYSTGRVIACCGN